MPYAFYAFISIIIFSLIHLWAEKIQTMTTLSQARFLSFGGGVAIAYVFIDLLPKLAKSNDFVEKSFGTFFFLERHVFIMALMGFLLFFTIERIPALVEKKWTQWLPIASYALFNFFVGYAVVDKNNPEVRPLLFFTFAFALHYFTNDYSLSEKQGLLYEQIGRWLLIFALILGGCVGMIVKLSATAVALVSAFIGGGVIMNVTRHELSETHPNSIKTFLMAAFMYTILLLSIHS